LTEVTASRSVLIEVLTILAKDLDKVVVVGGWVPELLFPNKGHIGSLDVDLALDPAKLVPLAYESIRQKLMKGGYQQLAEAENCFVRAITNPAIRVKIDLITGEFDGSVPEGTHLRIQGLPVWKAKGIDLAFRFQQEVMIEGTLPDGGRNRVMARLPTVAAFLCIKAITLADRKKEKDAYDICFCIDHYPGRGKALAEELEPHRDNTLIQQAITILRDKFASVEDVGPVWAAQTLQQTTMGIDIDLALEQRRAFELVGELLRSFDGTAFPIQG
jgi:hypothetical protein